MIPQFLTRWKFNKEQKIIRPFRVPPRKNWRKRNFSSQRIKTRKLNGFAFGRADELLKAHKRMLNFCNKCQKTLAFLKKVAIMKLRKEKRGGAYNDAERKVHSVWSGRPDLWHCHTGSQRSLKQQRSRACKSVGFFFFGKNLDLNRRRTRPGRPLPMNGKSELRWIWRRRRDSLSGVFWLPGKKLEPGFCNKIIIKERFPSRWLKNSLFLSKSKENKWIFEALYDTLK